MIAAPQDASPKSVRYFYRDPLAAAWMHRHFGMRLETQRLSHPDQMKEVDSEMLGSHMIAAFSFTFTTRFYVHPDSLSLLEPREGDEGVDGYGEQCTFRDGEWRIPHPVTSGADAWPTDPVTIDKRDGLSFMWPEQEAA
jgi:hypothetical protein